jgi:hypothetical protein
MGSILNVISFVNITLVDLMWFFQNILFVIFLVNFVNTKIGWMFVKYNDVSLIGGNY